MLLLSLISCKKHFMTIFIRTTCLIIFYGFANLIFNTTDLLYFYDLYNTFFQCLSLFSLIKICQELSFKNRYIHVNFKNNIENQQIKVTKGKKLCFNSLKRKLIGFKQKNLKLGNKQFNNLMLVYQDYKS